MMMLKNGKKSFTYYYYNVITSHLSLAI